MPDLHAHKATAVAPMLDAGDADGSLRLHPLTDSHEAEVLDFLAKRPLHTVFMTGAILDNGLTSALNRGSFYGCRNARDELEGVSLLGHLTLVEARTDRALQSFARFAQSLPRPHVILGESLRINCFWEDFAPHEAPRLISRDLMLELRSFADNGHQPIGNLRTATLGDLYPVMRVHANLIKQLTGVNPLHTDPVGYRTRAARRIGRNRIWVLMEDDRVIFKADIVGATPDVIYLEGVYVAPEERGKGVGSRCLSQLCRILLARGVSICLLVNEQNERALQLYFKTGFEVKSRYASFYVQNGKPPAAAAHPLKLPVTARRTRFASSDSAKFNPSA